MRQLGSLVQVGQPHAEDAPKVVPKTLIRNKELEQSHVCLGVSSYPQKHDESAIFELRPEHAARRFHELTPVSERPEKPGLAYAVFSGLSAYRDAGSFTIYAGCSNEAVGEVIDLVVEELRTIKPDARAGCGAAALEDHPQGQPDARAWRTRPAACRIWRGRRIYFDRHFGLDETLQGIERVTSADVQRVAVEVCSGTVRWRRPSWATSMDSQLPRERLNLN